MNGYKMMIAIVKLTKKSLDRKTKEPFTFIKDLKLIEMSHKNNSLGIMDLAIYKNDEELKEAFFTFYKSILDKVISINKDLSLDEEAKKIELNKIPYEYRHSNLISYEIDKVYIYQEKSFTL
jgi:hypothetical protein